MTKTAAKKLLTLDKLECASSSAGQRCLLPQQRWPFLVFHAPIDSLPDFLRLIVNDLQFTTWTFRSLPLPFFAWQYLLRQYFLLVTLFVTNYSLLVPLPHTNRALQGAQAKFVHFEYSRYFINLCNFANFLFNSTFLFVTLSEIARKFKVCDFCLRTL